MSSDESSDNDQKSTYDTASDNGSGDGPVTAGDSMGGVSLGGAGTSVGGAADLFLPPAGGLLQVLETDPKLAANLANDDKDDDEDSPRPKKKVVPELPWTRCMRRKKHSMKHPLFHKWLEEFGSGFTYKTASENLVKGSMSFLTKTKRGNLSSCVQKLLEAKAPQKSTGQSDLGSWSSPGDDVGELVGKLEAIRESPEVSSALQDWWDEMDVDREYGNVFFTEYKRISNLIWDQLAPEIGMEERDAIDSDFYVDAEPPKKKFVTKERWFISMMELVDCWEGSTEPEKYVLFLNTLRNNIGSEISRPLRVRKQQAEKMVAEAKEICKMMSGETMYSPPQSPCLTRKRSQEIFVDDYIERSKEWAVEESMRPVINKVKEAHRKLDKLSTSQMDQVKKTPIFNLIDGARKELEHANKIASIIGMRQSVQEKQKGMKSILQLEIGDMVDNTKTELDLLMNDIGQVLQGAPHPSSEEFMSEARKIRDNMPHVRRAKMEKHRPLPLEQSPRNSLLYHMVKKSRQADIAIVEYDKYNDTILEERSLSLLGPSPVIPHRTRAAGQPDPDLSGKDDVDTHSIPAMVGWRRPLTMASMRIKQKGTNSGLDRTAMPSRAQSSMSFFSPTKSTASIGNPVVEVTPQPRQSVMEELASFHEAKGKEKGKSRHKVDDNFVRLRDLVQVQVREWPPTKNKGPSMDLPPLHEDENIQVPEWNLSMEIEMNNFDEERKKMQSAATTLTMESEESMMMEPDSFVGKLEGQVSKAREAAEVDPTLQFIPSFSGGPARSQGATGTATGAHTRRTGTNENDDDDDEDEDVFREAEELEEKARRDRARRIAAERRDREKREMARAAGLDETMDADAIWKGVLDQARFRRHNRLIQKKEHMTKATVEFLEDAVHHLEAKVSKLQTRGRFEKTDPKPFKTNEIRRRFKPGQVPKWKGVGQGFRGDMAPRVELNWPLKKPKKRIAY